jgi:hypothetical protein
MRDLILLAIAVGTTGAGALTSYLLDRHSRRQP